MADDLYPPEAFPPAAAALGRALKAAWDSSEPVYAKRVEFLQQGLAHAKQCAATAGIVNNRKTLMAEKKAAISELAKLRRSLEHTNIANMDCAAIIEADSWADINGLFDP